MKKILLITIIFFLRFQLYAFSNEIQRVEFFSLEKGLSQSVVTCLFIDSRGFLWIGTQDGLNRYDGYKFNVFRHQPYNNKTISNNYIRSICEHDGSLYIATDFGLSRYLLDQNTFINYYYQPEDTTNSLPENKVYSLLKDRNGLIWIKTDNYISRYYPDENRFVNLKYYNDPKVFYRDYNQHHMVEDKLGNIWIGTKDGLLCVNKNNYTCKRYSHNPAKPNSLGNNNVRCLILTRDNSLLIGTESGVYEFIYPDTLFRKVQFNGITQENSSMNINFIYQDNFLQYWIGLKDNLFSFNKNYNLINRKLQFIGPNSAIQNTNFTCAIEDNSGIIWLGTFNGLLKMDQKEPKFKLYNKSVPVYSKMAGNDIGSLYAGVDDKIWVGFWSEGIDIIDKSKGVITHFDSKSNSSNRRILNNGVHAITKDNSGLLFFGTENGINVYNPETDELYKLSGLYSFIPDETFKDNRINAIYCDKNGEVVFLANHGLHILNQETGNFKSIYSIKKGGNEYLLDNVYSILRDHNNNVWVGTNSGLYIFDSGYEKFDYYQQETVPGKSSISNSSILCIYEDSRRNIWLGTATGLNKYNSSDKTFEAYTEQEGMPNTIIYNILEDENRNLWMSSNIGLIMLNIEKNEFNTYDIADGLQSNEFNYGAAFKNNISGELYFGGISGFNSFFADSIKINKTVPNIEITSFEIIHKEGTDLLQIGDKSNLILPIGINVFTIGFASLDYTWPEKNKYSYMLVPEGDDEEWVYLGKNHQATFSNLVPGKYVFKVKGSNSDNVWNETGKTLYITIKAPLWKTRAASITYMAAFLLLVFYVYMYRTRSLRRMNREYKEREIINAQIAKQKDELSIKNKNITDSINYAKRIQEAMMPSKNLFNKLLPESFVLYKPKDIVSGDFYWINENNGKIFVAAVDCTGHGVPGAFMSIIGFELFRKITNIQGIEEPGEIMNMLNKSFGDIFKDVENFSLKDGMDIAFCVIDKKKSIVEYAGAFNPLYIVRDDKISEVKGDRFSVGIDEELFHNQVFTNHMVGLEEEDVLYLFTDGYADQFGGRDGKKFKYRRFRHLLLNIHKHPMEYQREILDNTIEDWRGEFEQIDDILVIGIKPYGNTR